MRNRNGTLFMSVLLAATLLAPSSYSAELRGKVIMLKGEDITIRAEGDGVPQEGDKVELSFIADDEPIPVGTWKVTKVKNDGTVEACPVEIDGPPSLDMDAVIHATGTKVVKKEVTAKVSSEDKGEADKDKESRLEIACDNGDASACTALADYHFDYGIRTEDWAGYDPKWRLAEKFYEKGCDGGDAEACIKLTNFSARDSRRALELYERACLLYQGGDAKGWYGCEMAKELKQKLP